MPENDLLVTLEKEFNIIYSKSLNDFLRSFQLNYRYLEDFIDFAKVKDNNICLTSIPKISLDLFAKNDLNKCLNKYDKGKEHLIYYADYLFPKDYNCEYGKEYKDVWIFFFGKDEETIFNLLNRFHKLRMLT